MKPKHRKTQSACSKSPKKPVKSKPPKQNCEAESLVGTEGFKWTFPKSTRFGQKPSERPSEFLSLETTIGKGRKTGFGYGKRWHPSNPGGKDAPCPTAYTIPSVFSGSPGGKISASSLKTSETRFSTPGPGSYNIKTMIGQGAAYSFKSRQKIRSRKETPPPGAYNPNHSLVEPSRYASISFGARTSVDNLNRSSQPGPGSYELTSFFSFDLTKRTKRKNSF